MVFCSNKRMRIFMRLCQDLLRTRSNQSKEFFSYPINKLCIMACKT
jgi:hypothetical protein